MSHQFSKAQEMVNTERYPMADLDSGAGKTLVETCRKEFVTNGLCILPGFIQPEALEALADEANQLLDDAYFCNSTHNAYLTESDPELAPDDVAQRQEVSFVGSVAYDLLPDDGLLKRLYLWDSLKSFIGGILGKEPIFRFADPLGACSINVYVDGGEHGWHFDESKFTITLLLQQPDEGGLFEYVPQIRGLDNEKEIVQGVLEGNRQGVMQLPFTPGTLLIFAGDQTIHRVTRVSGTIPRLVPVLCFGETPGLVNSEEVRKLFWGRTATNG